MAAWTDSDLAVAAGKRAEAGPWDEFAQSIIADAKMVGDFVDHGSTHLLANSFGIRRANAQDRAAKDRHFVGRHKAVICVAMCQCDSFV